MNHENENRFNQINTEVKGWKITSQLKRNVLSDCSNRRYNVARHNNKSDNYREVHDRLISSNYLGTTKTPKRIRKCPETESAESNINRHDKTREKSRKNSVSEESIVSRHKRSLIGVGSILNSNVDRTVSKLYPDNVIQCDELSLAQRTDNHENANGKEKVLTENVNHVNVIKNIYRKDNNEEIISKTESKINKTRETFKGEKYNIRLGQYDKRFDRHPVRGASSDSSNLNVASEAKTVQVPHGNNKLLGNSNKTASVAKHSTNLCASKQADALSIKRSIPEDIIKSETREDKLRILHARTCANTQGQTSSSKTSRTEVYLRKNERGKFAATAKHRHSNGIINGQKLDKNDLVGLPTLFRKSDRMKNEEEKCDNLLECDKTNDYTLTGNSQKDSKYTKISQVPRPVICKRRSVSQVKHDNESNTNEKGLSTDHTTRSNVCHIPLSKLQYNTRVQSTEGGKADDNVHICSPELPLPILPEKQIVSHLNKTDKTTRDDQVRTKRSTDVGTRGQRDNFNIHDNLISEANEAFQNKTIGKNHSPVTRSGVHSSSEHRVGSYIYWNTCPNTLTCVSAKEFNYESNYKEPCRNNDELINCTGQTEKINEDPANPQRLCYCRDYGNDPGEDHYKITGHASDELVVKWCKSCTTQNEWDHTLPCQSDKIIRCATNNNPKHCNENPCHGDLKISVFRHSTDDQQLLQEVQDKIGDGLSIINVCKEGQDRKKSRTYCGMNKHSITSGYPSKEAEQILPNGAPVSENVSSKKQPSSVSCKNRTKPNVQAFKKQASIVSRQEIKNKLPTTSQFARETCGLDKLQNTSLGNQSKNCFSTFENQNRVLQDGIQSKHDRKSNHLNVQNSGLKTNEERINESNKDQEHSSGTRPGCKKVALIGSKLDEKCLIAKHSQYYQKVNTSASVTFTGTNEDVFVSQNSLLRSPSDVVRTNSISEVLEKVDDNTCSDIIAHTHSYTEICTKQGSSANNNPFDEKYSESTSLEHDRSVTKFDGTKVNNDNENPILELKPKIIGETLHCLQIERPGIISSEVTNRFTKNEKSVDTVQRNNESIPPVICDTNQNGYLYQEKSPKSINIQTNEMNINEVCASDMILSESENENEIKTVVMDKCKFIMESEDYNEMEIGSDNTLNNTNKGYDTEELISNHFGRLPSSTQLDKCRTSEECVSIRDDAQRQHRLVSALNSQHKLGEQKQTNADIDVSCDNGQKLKDTKDEKHINLKLGKKNSTNIMNLKQTKLKDDREMSRDDRTNSRQTVNKSSTDRNKKSKLSPTNLLITGSRVPTLKLSKLSHSDKSETKPSHSDKFITQQTKIKRKISDNKISAVSPPVSRASSSKSSKASSESSNSPRSSVERSYESINKTKTKTTATHGNQKSKPQTGMRLNTSNVNKTSKEPDKIEQNTKMRLPLNSSTKLKTTCSSNTLLITRQRDTKSSSPDLNKRRLNKSSTLSPDMQRRPSKSTSLSPQLNKRRTSRSLSRSSKESTPDSVGSSMQSLSSPRLSRSSVQSLTSPILPSKNKQNQLQSTKSRLRPPSLSSHIKQSKVGESQQESSSSQRRQTIVKRNAIPIRKVETGFLMKTPKDSPVLSRKSTTETVDSGPIRKTSKVSPMLCRKSSKTETCDKTTMKKTSERIQNKKAKDSSKLSSTNKRELLANKTDIKNGSDKSEANLETKPPGKPECKSKTTTTHAKNQTSRVNGNSKPKVEQQAANIRSPVPQKRPEGNSKSPLLARKPWNSPNVTRSTKVSSIPTNTLRNRSDKVHVGLLNSGKPQARSKTSGTSEKNGMNNILKSPNVSKRTFDRKSTERSPVSVRKSTIPTLKQKAQQKCAKEANQKTTTIIKVNSAIEKKDRVNLYPRTSTPLSVKSSKNAEKTIIKTNLQSAKKNAKTAGDEKNTRDLKTMEHTIQMKNDAIKNEKTDNYLSWKSNSKNKKVQKSKANDMSVQNRCSASSTSQGDHETQNAILTNSKTFHPVLSDASDKTIIEKACETKNIGKEALSVNSDNYLEENSSQKINETDTLSISSDEFWSASDDESLDNRSRLKCDFKYFASGHQSSEKDIHELDLEKSCKSNIQETSVILNVDFADVMKNNAKTADQLVPVCSNPEINKESVNAQRDTEIGKQLPQMRQLGESQHRHYPIQVADDRETKQKYNASADDNVPTATAKKMHKDYNIQNDVFDLEPRNITHSLKYDSDREVSNVNSVQLCKKDKNQYVSTDIEAKLLELTNLRDYFDERNDKSEIQINEDSEGASQSEMFKKSSGNEDSKNAMDNLPNLSFENGVMTQHETQDGLYSLSNEVSDQNICFDLSTLENTPQTDGNGNSVPLENSAPEVCAIEAASNREHKIWNHGTELNSYQNANHCSTRDNDLDTSKPQHTSKGGSFKEEQGKYLDHEFISSHSSDSECSDLFYSDVDDSMMDNRNGETDVPTDTSNSSLCSNETNVEIHHGIKRRIKRQRKIITRSERSVRYETVTTKIVGPDTNKDDSEVRASEPSVNSNKFLPSSSCIVTTSRDSKITSYTVTGKVKGDSVTDIHSYHDAQSINNLSNISAVQHHEYSNLFVTARKEDDDTSIAKNAEFNSNDCQRLEEKEIFNHTEYESQNVYATFVINDNTSDSGSRYSKNRLSDVNIVLKLQPTEIQDTINCDDDIKKLSGKDETIIQQEVNVTLNLESRDQNNVCDSLSTYVTNSSSCESANSLDINASSISTIDKKIDYAKSESTSITDVNESHRKLSIPFESESGTNKADNEPTDNESRLIVDTIHKDVVDKISGDTEVLNNKFDHESSVSDIEIIGLNRKNLNTNEVDCNDESKTFPDINSSFNNKRRDIENDTFHTVQSEINILQNLGMSGDGFLKANKNITKQSEFAENQTESMTNEQKSETSKSDVVDMISKGNELADKNDNLPADMTLQVKKDKDRQGIRRFTATVCLQDVQKSQNESSHVSANQIRSRSKSPIGLKNESGVESKQGVSCSAPSRVSELRKTLIGKASKINIPEPKIERSKCTSPTSQSLPHNRNSKWIIDGGKWKRVPVDDDGNPITQSLSSQPPTKPSNEQSPIICIENKANNSTAVPVSSPPEEQSNEVENLKVSDKRAIFEKIKPKQPPKVLPKPSEAQRRRTLVNVVQQWKGRVADRRSKEYDDSLAIEKTVRLVTDTKTENEHSNSLDHRSTEEISLFECLETKEIKIPSNVLSVHTPSVKPSEEIEKTELNDNEKTITDIPAIMTRKDSTSECKESTITDVGHCNDRYQNQKTESSADTMNETHVKKEPDGETNETEENDEFVSVRRYKMGSRTRQDMASIRAAGVWDSILEQNVTTGNRSGDMHTQGTSDLEDSDETTPTNTPKIRKSFKNEEIISRQQEFEVTPINTRKLKAIKIKQEMFPREEPKPEIILNEINLQRSEYNKMENKGVHDVKFYLNNSDEESNENVSEIGENVSSYSESGINKTHTNIPVPQKSKYGLYSHALHKEIPRRPRETSKRESEELLSEITEHEEVNGGRGLKHQGPTSDPCIKPPKDRKPVNPYLHNNTYNRSYSLPSASLSNTPQHRIIYKNGHFVIETDLDNESEASCALEEDLKLGPCLDSPSNEKEEPLNKYSKGRSKSEANLTDSFHESMVYDEDEDIDVFMKNEGDVTVIENNNDGSSPNWHILVKRRTKPEGRDEEDRKSRPLSVDENQLQRLIESDSEEHSAEMKERKKPSENIKRRSASFKEIGSLKLKRNSSFKKAQEKGLYHLMTSANRNDSVGNLSLSLSEYSLGSDSGGKPKTSGFLQRVFKRNKTYNEKDVDTSKSGENSRDNAIRKMSLKSLFGKKNKQELMSQRSLDEAISPPIAVFQGDNDIHVDSAPNSPYSSQFRRRHTSADIYNDGRAHSLPRRPSDLKKPNPLHLKDGHISVRSLDIHLEDHPKRPISPKPTNVLLPRRNSNISLPSSPIRDQCDSPFKSSSSKLDSSDSASICSGGSSINDAMTGEHSKQFERYQSRVQEGEMTPSNSNDSGIQRDVSFHSSNESLKKIKSRQRQHSLCDCSLVGTKGYETLHIEKSCDCELAWMVRKSNKKDAIKGSLSSTKSLPHGSSSCPDKKTELQCSTSCPGLSSKKGSSKSSKKQKKGRGHDKSRKFSLQQEQINTFEGGGEAQDQSSLQKSAITNDNDMKHQPVQNLMTNFDEGKPLILDPNNDELVQNNNEVTVERVCNLPDSDTFDKIENTEKSQQSQQNPDTNSVFNAEPVHTDDCQSSINFSSNCGERMREASDNGVLENGQEYMIKSKLPESDNESCRKGVFNSSNKERFKNVQGNESSTEKFKDVQESSSGAEMYKDLQGTGGSTKRLKDIQKTGVLVSDDVDGLVSDENCVSKTDSQLNSDALAQDQPNTGNGRLYSFHEALKFFKQNEKGSRRLNQKTHTNSHKQTKCGNSSDRLSQSDSESEQEYTEQTIQDSSGNVVRRRKSPSPRPERPKSEISVRWADLVETAEITPVKRRDSSQRNKQRPKSDLEDNIQLFDEMYEDVIEDYDFLTGGSSIEEDMKPFGSQLCLLPYSSLQSLEQLGRQYGCEQKPGMRRMSTPHPIKSRLERAPRKQRKRNPLVRSHSMPESLDKLTKKKKFLTAIASSNLHREEVILRHFDDDSSSDNDSECSGDHISLHEKSLSARSSSSYLTTLQERPEPDTLTYAEALWDHITMDPEELGFRAGDVIEVGDMSDKDWWWGVIDDREGWFPATFVRLRVNQEPQDFGNHRDDLTEHSSPINRRISVINTDQARENVVNEIIHAERDYVKHLKDVVEGYIRHARKREDMFSEERLSVIFGNMEEIYEFSKKFLEKIENSFNKESPNKSQLGTCFLECSKEFEIYSDYCNNHPSASEELKELYRNKKYKHFFEACRLLQEMMEIPLEGFLLTPVQKICKYPLQLNELLKYTPVSHPDHKNIEGALEAMKKIAMLINERKRKMESIEKLAYWQTAVEDWQGPDLLEDSSELIYAGEMNKINTAGWSQERNFFLFDHQLVYCKKDLLKKNGYSYKGRVDLDDCEIINLEDGKDAQYNVTVKHAWKLHEVSRDKWYLLYTKTNSEKEKWLKAFTNERTRVREDQENNFVPLYWKRMVLDKIKSSQEKSRSSSNQGNYQKDFIRGIPSHATMPRSYGKKGQKKKGWFGFGNKKAAK